MESMLLRPLE